MARFAFFSISLFALLSFFNLADGHGAMVAPCVRGASNTNSIFNSMPSEDDDLYSLVAYCKNMNVDGMDLSDCPHCLNAGGKGAVILASNNKWTPYEPVKSGKSFKKVGGLCGDPLSGAHAGDHEAGGKFGWPKSPIAATYKQDSVVEFVVDLTTNHQGYFEFFICDVEKCGGDINEKCFHDGHCHKLMREKTPACEAGTSKRCSPVDSEYPGRWYIGCRVGGHVGEHFVGGKYMRYHLPKGFNTKHAVLQWYWVTANSCNPPGFINYFKKYPMDAWEKCPGDGGTMGGRNPTIAECGGGVFPEEFWNCADVAVTSSGAADTVPVAPEPPAPVATAPAVPEPAPPAPVAVTSEPTAADATAPPTNKLAATVPATASIDSSDNDSSELRDLETKKNIEEPETASPEPAFTPEPTVTPAPSILVANNEKSCAISWEQCGGIFYTGPKNCCEGGFECISNSKYYSQCRKKVF